MMPNERGQGRPDNSHNQLVEFLESTYKVTFRFARRMAGRNDDLARDITQEAYTELIDRWHKLDKSCPNRLHGYVIRTVTRAIYDHYERQRRLTNLDETNEPWANESGYYEVTDYSSLLTAVLRFLDAQPPRRRIVGVLKFLMDWTYADIAETLGITESTVRSHVGELRIRIKPYIDEMNHFGQGGD